jgi:carbon monoxide dehydrogenase subunit G
VIEGRASVVVSATPEQVLAFVLDLEQYRQADRKIVDVRSVRGDDVRGEVVFTARLRGLPTPADRQTYEVAPDRRSVEFRSVPSRWPGLLARFHGIVLCESEGSGTHVTHVERFTFARPLAWLAQPYLRSWLQRDTTQEVERMADQLAATGRSVG